MPLFRTSEYYIKQILEKEVKLLTSRLKMTSGPCSCRVNFDSAYRGCLEVIVVSGVTLIVPVFPTARHIHYGTCCEDVKWGQPLRVLMHIAEIVRKLVHTKRIET